VAETKKRADRSNVICGENPRNRAIARCFPAKEHSWVARDLTPCRLGISEVTYCRGRIEHGDRAVAQFEGLKEREAEIARPKKIVAEPALDHQVLTEIAR
jgi:hypothetical protein